MLKTYWGCKEGSFVPPPKAVDAMSLLWVLSISTTSPEKWCLGNKHEALRATRRKTLIWTLISKTPNFDGPDLMTIEHCVRMVEVSQVIKVWPTLQKKIHKHNYQTLHYKLGCQLESVTTRSGRTRPRWGQLRNTECLANGSARSFTKHQSGCLWAHYKLALMAGHYFTTMNSSSWANWSQLLYTAKYVLHVCLLRAVRPRASHQQHFYVTCTLSQ